MPAGEPEGAGGTAGPAPAHRILVIQPGSLHVRVGRASDLVPARALHCVARRARPAARPHRDPLLPPAAAPSRQLEESRLLVSHALQAAGRYATPPQQVAAFNRRSGAQSVAPAAAPAATPTADTLVGDAALDAAPDAPYHLHFPYRRGDFNLHSGVGGSLTSVLGDLFTIWSWIIENKLGIPLIELAKYRCVLLVPDIYNRSHLKALTTLLLKDFGFGHCFLIQESVSAAFGSGIGYACIVDVGDQKTSVSCVEDGISHKTTRLRLDYGAGDACQTLVWLFQKSAFPYKEWNENNPCDVALMRNLYQDFCHINLDMCGAQEKTFIVDHPGRKVYKYTMQVGDECLIAPLSLFNTDLLNITGPKSTTTQQRQASDPEDPYDAEYIRETGRKKDTADTGGNDSQQLDNTIGEGQQSANPEEDIVVDAVEAPVDSVTVAPGQVLALDAAILQSIDRCPSEELKRKMYSNILIVGGGVKVQGLAAWLQNRLALQIPYTYKTEQVDIVTCPKDIDPACTAWKGAAIMSCLESASELWINQREWHNYGLKILRERAPFIW